MVPMFRRTLLPPSSVHNIKTQKTYDMNLHCHENFKSHMKYVNTSILSNYIDGQDHVE